MASCFLFYDIETTGLNKSFDQVLQFAAIRTDESLQEKERYSCLIRLRPDVIPSPQAMMTHQIAIADILSDRKAQNEFDAIRAIHALFNQPGTISAGYNTLKFDDEFLRFAFYRNLLPPYTHQYAAGCRRIDLLPMAVIYSLFKPDVLRWPQTNGRKSLKLEHINALNGFVRGPSHDALQDVLATVEMARCFIRERPIWEYLLACFDKRTDQKRITQCPEKFQSALGSHRFGLAAGAEYGAEQHYLAPVLSIGRSIPYSNQQLWLRLDLPELQQTRPDSVDANTWVIRKRYGEPPVILPPLERYQAKVDNRRQAICRENLQWLQHHTDLFERIVSYYREYRYPEIPDVDADGALYQNGFLSSGDQKLCREFHESSLADKLNMVAKFSDDVTCDLAARVIFRNFLPDVSADLCRHDDLRQRCKAFFSQRHHADHEDEGSSAPRDYKGEKRLSVSTALQEIRELEQQEDVSATRVQVLQALKSYLQNNYDSRKEFI